MWIIFIYNSDAIYNVSRSSSLICTIVCWDLVLLMLHSETMIAICQIWLSLTHLVMVWGNSSAGTFPLVSCHIVHYFIC